jgi:ABC-2 type transport system ATP-binding protein
VYEVSIDKLVKQYGDITALKNLTFNVDRSSMYGLIGPDGSGKTTFMRIASCLLMQSSGSVTISGYDSVKSSSKIKRIIGYMPQKFSLYPDLSVMENFVFFADLFGIAKKERNKRIERMIDFSRLGPFINRRAGKLSGGMKKKLALACTLIHTPKVLLLDEPTTGVDAVSRREFWNILAEVKNSGTTIIVSTPYMDEAERCDRVGFIMNGVLISEGPPEDFPKRFKKEILEVRSNDIVRKSRKLIFPDIVKNVNAFGDRLHISVENAQEATDVIHDFLSNNGIDNAVIETVLPTMEDVFVESITDGI